MGQQLPNVATQEVTTIELNRNMHSVVRRRVGGGGVQLVCLRFHVADAPALLFFIGVAHLKTLSLQIITMQIGVLLNSTETQISSRTTHQFVRELSRIAFVKTR